MERDKTDAELLYGMPAIAEYLGLGERQARHLASKAEFPTFKVGRMTCARRSSLKAWLCRLEAEAVKGSNGGAR